MSDYIIEELVILLVVGAVAAVAIWQVGASRRAKAALARDTDYRAIVERAVAAQTATEGRLADVTSHLAEMNLRMAAIERVLKEVE